MRPKRRLTPGQRRALELLTAYPHGTTHALFVSTHGVETKTLAGLVDEGLATALIGEGIEVNGKTVEVVRIGITDAGRWAING